MFDRIAPVYDSMNRLMTAGLDRRWRRETAAAVVRPGTACSTSAAGQATLRSRLPSAGGRVTGLDFSAPMLERARREVGRDRVARGRRPVAAVSGRDRSTPSRSASASGTCRTPSAGSQSCAASSGRVGGWRSSRSRGPRGSLAPFYRLWFDGVIPLAGKVLPGGSAYSYLPASVRRFPAPEGLAKLLDEAGFDEISWRLFARRHRRAAQGDGPVSAHRHSPRRSRPRRLPRPARGAARRRRRGQAGPRRRDRSRGARRGREAPAAAARLPHGVARRTIRRSRPASRSSSSTWRASSTTT